jgi:hypothetical protein
MTLVVGLAVFVAAVFPALVESLPPPHAVNMLVHGMTNVFAVVLDWVQGGFFTN